MTLSIQLDPETESALRSKASEAGTDPSRLVEDLVRREYSLPPLQVRPMSHAEVDADIAELRALSSTATGLRDPNFTRETIYQDHD